MTESQDNASPDLRLEDAGNLEAKEAQSQTIELMPLESRLNCLAPNAQEKVEVEGRVEVALKQN